jgi:hypothetical protein
LPLFNSFTDWLRGRGSPAQRILVAGDSHVRFWAGHDTLRENSGVYRDVHILWTGPATAYHAASAGSSTSALAKIRTHLNADPKRFGCVVLCFGEIDCRVHILVHALRENVSIQASVDRVVSNYMELVDRLRREFRIPILLWGPIASAPDSGSFHPAYPTIGSTKERNFATLSFAKALRREASKRRHVGQFDILPTLIDAALESRREYFLDGCHLNQRGMCDAVQALRACLTRMELQSLLPALERLPVIAERPARRNIADGLRYRVSSSMPGVTPQPFSGDPSSGYKFHTMLETNPFIEFDFGSAYLLDEIVVYNRSADCQERARNLRITASVDGVAYIDLFEPCEPVIFGGVHEGTPCHVKVRVSKPFRLLRLFLGAEQYFHLDFVQVFALSFLTEVAVPLI